MNGGALSIFQVTIRTLSRASPLPQVQRCPCGSRLARDLALSASHAQEFWGGLRSKLNAIAANTSTPSNNTAHRPNFFQSVPAGA